MYKNILSSIKNLNTYILDILFPPVCISCHMPIDKQSDFLCRACFDKININMWLVCPLCGGKRITKSPCHHAPFVLAAACAYHEPIPALIHHYKYAGLEKLQTLLAALMITHIQRAVSDISSYIITYIPLHPHKERMRGFNQSKKLAHIIAHYFSIPCFDLLAKTKHTEPQAKQKERIKRLENVRGCFECINPNDVRGKRILLIDDVCTSGATLWEAARVLQKNHPRTIVALTIAKAE